MPTQATPFTTLRLIQLAAKNAGVLGIGQTLQAEDIQDIFDTLNLLINEWSNRRLAVYCLIDVAFQATGAASYTIGSGGDINTPWVKQLEGAEFTQNNVVYPLRIIHSHEDWKMRIALPSLSSFPEYIFLDTTYPLGTLYVWPIPDSTYTVTMQIMQVLQQFVYSNDPFNMPPVYQNALIYELACRICVLFAFPISRELATARGNSIKAMQLANTQIQLLAIDNSLLRKGHYNIYADRST